MKRSNLSSVMAIAVLIGCVVPAGAQAIDRQSLRDDAFLLMEVGAWVPGVAAYCNKYVTSNTQLLAAATAWNARHLNALAKVKKIVEWSGGLSEFEKELVDKFALSLLEKQMDEQSDKVRYCSDAEAALSDGSIDLEKSEITAAAYRRIMNANISQ